MVVAKFSPDLRKLLWCTYLGGSGDESPRGGLAVAGCVCLETGPSATIADRLKLPSQLFAVLAFTAFRGADRRSRPRPNLADAPSQTAVVDENYRETFLPLCTGL